MSNFRHLILLTKKLAFIKFARVGQGYLASREERMIDKCVAGQASVLASASFVRSFTCDRCVCCGRSDRRFTFSDHVVHPAGAMADGSPANLALQVQSLTALALAVKGCCVFVWAACSVYSFSALSVSLSLFSPTRESSNRCSSCCGPLQPG